MDTFRKLISLGVRCDVAFQLRAHSGDNTSHFFDWLATPTGGVITVLKRDFDVFHPDHLEWRAVKPAGVVVDRLTNITFYHQFPYYRGNAPPHFNQFYSTFAGKFAHLAQKFRATVAAGPVMLVRRNITAVDARRVEETFFETFPGSDARFLYLVHGNEMFRTDAGHSVPLQPSRRSVGAAGEWIPILQEAGLIEEPYRLCAEEVLGRDQDDYRLNAYNRFDEAELLQAIAINPTHAGFHGELAHLYKAERALDKAVDQLDRAVACAPEQPRWRQERTLLLWRLGRLTQSQALATLDPVLPTGRGHFARETVRLMLACGDPQQARQLCIVLTAQDPEDAELFALKSRACQAAHHLREAVFASERAVELAPDNTAYKTLHAEMVIKADGSTLKVAAA